MQAGELLGVVFGVLGNMVLPPVVIIVFLFVVLGWNSARTIRKVREGSERARKQN